MNLGCFFFNERDLFIHFLYKIVSLIYDFKFKMLILFRGTRNSTSILVNVSLIMIVLIINRSADILICIFIAILIICSFISLSFILILIVILHSIISLIIIFYFIIIVMGPSIFYFRFYIVPI